jgi:hypothetical protein
MSQIIKPGSGGGGGSATLVNDNTTVQWVQTGSTYTQDFGLQNLLIGSDGTGSPSGDVNFNVAVGDGALGALTAGFDNVAVGYNAMENATSGGGQIAIGALALSSNPVGVGDSAENVAIGYQCLEDLTAGTQNVCIGTASASSLVTGSANIALGSGSIGQLVTTTIDEPNICLGFESLGNLTSGGLNIAIGHNAGNTLTSTESNNIYLGNIGVVTENGTLRIGGSPSSPPGNINLSAAFIAGIAGVTTSNSQMVTINTSTGQLGSAAIPGGTVSSMLAYKSSGTANATGDGTTVTVVFDTVTYDQHSDYNNTTGAFTAPVTGTYMVSGNVSIQNLGTTTEWTVFVQSTLYTMFCTSNNAVNVGNTGLVWLPFSALVRLPAGDFIEIQVQGAGGTKNNTIFGAGGYFTWLTIALVNPG